MLRWSNHGTKKKHRFKHNRGRRTTKEPELAPARARQTPLELWISGWPPLDAYLAYHWGCRVGTFSEAWVTPFGMCTIQSFGGVGGITFWGNQGVVLVAWMGSIFESTFGPSCQGARKCYYFLGKSIPF